jgi:myosin heavy subunit
VTHAPGERGYHVFYELCAGASKEQKKACKLRGASDFAYLAAPAGTDAAGLALAKPT